MTEPLDARGVPIAPGDSAVHCWHWHNPNGGRWQDAWHVKCCPCLNCTCGTVKHISETPR